MKSWSIFDDLKMEIEIFIMWGEVIQESEEDNLAILEFHILELYKQYFLFACDYKDVEYSGNLKVAFDELAVRETLSSNFPSFGYYHTVLNMDEVDKEAELGVGDLIDDMCEIIRDLKDVMRYYKKRGEESCLKRFVTLFRTHTLEHISNIIYYINKVMPNRSAC